MSGAVSYRYPWQAMVPDYLRAVAGVACTAGPLALMSLPVVVAAVLAGLASVFVAFAVHAIVRQATTILVSTRDIRALPLGTQVDWERLTRLRLAYFSVRRDGRAGWMELKLASGRRTLRIDSRLEGFTDVVQRAARAAERARLDLEPSTLSNLAELGISTGAGEVPWERR